MIQGVIFFFFSTLCKHSAKRHIYSRHILLHNNRLKMRNATLALQHTGYVGGVVLQWFKFTRVCMGKTVIIDI